MLRLLALGLLGFASLAQAQEPAAPKLTLSLTVRQTQLIAETLRAIGCPNVGQLIVCQEAVDLVRDILEQAKAQVK